MSAALAFANGQREQEQVPFSWTMTLINARTGESIPFSEPIEAQTGDRFRLVIRTEGRGFGNVVSESSTGEEVTVIYSGPLRGGEVWESPLLELVPPEGTASLFVVVSDEEQRTLAQRITAFQNNSGATQRRALMNEIFRIRGEVSDFWEVPETPVLMGGAVRSQGMGGMGFSDANTYVYTISFEH